MSRDLALGRMKVGKKDSLLSEVRKMRDYCQRWEQYEQELEK